MPDNLLQAAKRARDFASNLLSPETRAAFVEMAERWEREARMRPKMPSENKDGDSGSKSP